MVEVDVRFALLSWLATAAHHLQCVVQATGQGPHHFELQYTVLRRRCTLYPWSTGSFVILAREVCRPPLQTTTFPWERGWSSYSGGAVLYAACLQRVRGEPNWTGPWKRIVLVLHASGPLCLLPLPGLGSREQHDNITAPPGAWSQVAGLEEDVSTVCSARRNRDCVLPAGNKWKFYFFYSNTICS
jgi:hypothetical protein